MSKEKIFLIPSVDVYIDNSVIAGREELNYPIDVSEVITFGKVIPSTSTKFPMGIRFYSNAGNFFWGYDNREDLDNDYKILCEKFVKRISSFNEK